MAYKLKTTGIAANCTMAIAVDPDTGTIKDFASSAVTADMTVGANVEIGSQVWDGNNRHYWRLGSGNTAADFIAFGATKPNWPGNTNGPRTWVWIGQLDSGASVRVFGGSSSDYAAAANLSSGGATHPYQGGMGMGTAFNGGFSVAAGDKRIFGMSQVHGSGGYITAYTALHDDGSMSKTSGGAPTSTAGASNVDLQYVGRRNDNTGHQRDYVHMIAIFDIALSESQWDSLRDDWFSVLLEPDDPGDPPLGTVTISDVTPGASSALVTYSYDDSDQTGFEYRIDGGSPAALGASPATISGLTAETEYDLEIRAVNANGAGAWSSVETFTTLSGDETGPVMVGDIEVSSLTRTGYTLTWEAATDNVAVTGYEYSLDGGSTWTDAGDVLTVNISGRTAGATDQVRVRAYDAAENVAVTPLSEAVTLLTGVIVITDEPFKRNNGTLIAGKGFNAWVHGADGTLIAATTGATDGSGIPAADIESNSIVASTSYRVDYRFEDGEFGVDWITSEAT